MESILNIIEEVRKLERVPCPINLIEYTEKLAGIDINKTLIYVIGEEDDKRTAIYYEYSPNAIVMYQEQYDNIFKPIFENLSRLNHQVAELQKKLEWKEGEENK